MVFLFVLCANIFVFGYRRVTRYKPKLPKQDICVTVWGAAKQQGWGEDVGSIDGQRSPAMDQTPPWLAELCSMEVDARCPGGRILLGCLGIIRVAVNVVPYHS